MSNRETRVVKEYLHLYLGLQRTKTNKYHRCCRHVIRDEAGDLEVFKNKLKTLGGTWRIHKTVNARCPEKAMKVLMKTLIDHPEKASVIDQEWRTSLLQRNCIYGKKRFMFDVDTKDKDKIEKFESMLKKGMGIIISLEYPFEKYESPNGWHYVSVPFDTRSICELDYVTLLRDGYYFVCSV